MYRGQEEGPLIGSAALRWVVVWKGQSESQAKEGMRNLSVLPCSRKESWSGLPFPSPGDLPDLGIEPVFLHWQMDSLPLSHLGVSTIIVDTQSDRIVSLP